MESSLSARQPYLIRVGTGPTPANGVIHLFTIQLVGFCGDDIPLVPTSLKFFSHVVTISLQYGTGDLTTVPRAFNWHVNDHICLKRYKNTVTTYCTAMGESYETMSLIHMNITKVIRVTFLLVV